MWLRYGIAVVVLGAIGNGLQYLLGAGWPQMLACDVFFVALAVGLVTIGRRA